jgi:subtilase family serine protease
MAAVSALALALAALLLLPGAVAASLAPSGAGAAAAPGAAAPFTTDAVAVPARALASPLPLAADVTLTFTLRLAHPGALGALLAAQEDPGSPEYRRYLSAPQFEARFAPAPSSLAAVAGALGAAGGRSVEPTADGLAVSGTFSVASAEKLLGVRMVSYPSAVLRGAYTSLGPARLPAALASLVGGVDGLAGGVPSTPSSAVLRSSVAAPVGSVTPEFVGAGFGSPVDWYVGSDFAQAYNATRLWPGNQSVVSATFPTRVAIATLLASGYNATGATVLPPWDPHVVDAYFNDTLAPSWPKPVATGVPVNVSGVPAPPSPGSFHGVGDSTLDEFENSLDLEMAGSLAPGAHLYNFYFSGAVLANGFLPEGDLADDFGATLAAALSYDYAPANLSVVSCSFGLPDVDDALWDTELLHAAAMGVTVLAASGDQADAPASLNGRGQSPWPLWPSTAAFNTSGVLSVGGATVVLAGQPTATYNGSPLQPSYDANVTGVSAATAWYDTSQGAGAYAGTEGGISSVYPEPYWQLHSAAQPDIVDTSILEGASDLGRAGPDLGFPANRTIAYVFANGSNVIYFSILEGTSVATPVGAGLLADVVAVLTNRSGAFSPLGFLDPVLYRIASFYANATASAGAVPSDPFVPVTSGHNYEFPASSGWDPLTGWGGFDPVRFLEAYSNTTIVNYTYTGPVPLPPLPNPPAVAPAAFPYLIGGLGVGGVLLMAAVAVSTSPRPGPARPLPPRAGVVPPPAYAGAPAVRGYTGPTFLCPYCGAARPAEPTRCPSCGSL